MKSSALKRYAVIPVILIMILSLSSCLYIPIKPDDNSPDAQEPETFTVNLVNGGRSSSVSLQKGEVIPDDLEPMKEGYIFDGWYTDEECEDRFLGTVASDITLYAGWKVDIFDIVNNVSTKYLSASFMVQNTSYKKGLYGTSKDVFIGSGILFKMVYKTAYVLTNYHVIEKEGYTDNEFLVFDCYGKEYNAYLVAKDPESDLAVLRFTTNAAYERVVFGDGELKAGDAVIALGSPNGVFNCITCGEVVKTEIVESNSQTEAEGVDLPFAVIWHTVPVDHGSSGGALFDENSQLVGLNYASYTDGGEFVNGLAIPVSQIKEFLEENGISY